MLIGIDASRAISATPTGTETYSRELVHALLALDRSNDYCLYTRTRASEGNLTRSPRVQIRPIPLPRLWTHVRLSWEMLRHPPDLLFVPAHVLPLVHPRRSVVTVHDLGHLHFRQAHPAAQRMYHTWAARWNARAAARVLADSEATRDDLVRFCGIAESKIRVVYPAYDAAIYRQVQNSEKIKRVTNQFRIERDYVLAVGTVHPRKNYARLIQAFSRIKDFNLQLVIVGKRGWLYESIYEQVTKLGLQTRVLFLAYVPIEDMPALVSGARVLAFPSLHEGFGMPVLEAQACGTPVVCSMTSSLPEVAGDGALFVDPYDVDALAAAIERVMTDSALRDKIINNGFRNIKRFSWDASARAVLDIFGELE